MSYNKKNERITGSLVLGSYTALTSWKVLQQLGYTLPEELRIPYYLISTALSTYVFYKLLKKYSNKKVLVGYKTVV